MRCGALAHDEHGAFGEYAAHAAGVVHVVMRQHEPFDRLAGEALSCGVHHPHRLRIADGRVDHDQVIAHLDQQAVVRAADDVEHAGRELVQAQALHCPRVEARVVGIHVGADELAPDHPLVGQVAGRGLGGVGAQLARHGELARIDRGIRLEIGELDFLDHPAVQLVLAVHRNTHTVEVAPVRVHDVVVHVAPDIVVVKRAHAHR